MGDKGLLVRSGMQVSLVHLWEISLEMCPEIDKNRAALPGRERQGVNFYVCFCVLLFSCLQLKIILCQSGIFWGGIY